MNRTIARVNRVTRVSRLGGVAAPAPTAPAGAVFAAVSHPSCCRSDAANTVPCGAGDAIRWWKELVTGTWYEQATSGARLILRDAGGGKWYAEGDLGRTHVFTGFSAGAGTGTLHVAAGWEPSVTSGVGSIPPFDSKPGAVGTIRGAANLVAQAVDGGGNPFIVFSPVSAGTGHTFQVRHVAATGVLSWWLDGSLGGTTGSTPAATLTVQSPQIGGSTGIGGAAGKIYAEAYYDAAADPTAVGTWVAGYMP